MTLYIAGVAVAFRWSQDIEASNTGRLFIAMLWPLWLLGFIGGLI